MRNYQSIFDKLSLMQHNGFGEGRIGEFTFRVGQYGYVIITLKTNSLPINEIIKNLSLKPSDDIYLVAGNRLDIDFN